MKKKDTSWENVADWYGQHLEEGDTYHARVLLPNLKRILELDKAEAVLDLACGEGYFTRAFAQNAKTIVGCDLSPSLIERAKIASPKIPFHIANATHLSFAADASFDVVLCVLALQNMQSLPPVFAEVARVLTKTGRFIFVLNHPAFRIPKKSSWGYDEKERVQYRRIDAYLSSAKIEIDTHPGSAAKEFTYSFHRSLQDYTKALRSAGLSITRLEEWISHKVSEKGPRAAAEDHSRKEIPLFLAIEVEKRSAPKNASTS